MKYSGHQPLNIVCVTEKEVTAVLETLELQNVLWRDKDTPTSFREHLNAPVTICAHGDGLISYYPFIWMGEAWCLGQDFVGSFINGEQEYTPRDEQKTKCWQAYLAYVKEWANEHMHPDHILSEHLDFKSWLVRYRNEKEE